MHSYLIFRLKKWPKWFPFFPSWYFPKYHINIAKSKSPNGALNITNTNLKRRRAKWEDSTSRLHNFAQNHSNQNKVALAKGTHTLQWLEWTVQTHAFRPVTDRSMGIRLEFEKMVEVRENLWLRFPNI